MTARLISGERELPLDQLQDRAERAAAGFAALGIAKGDAVAIMLRNDFAFFEASAAIGQLGGYPVPVNWHYTIDEADYLFRNCDAKAIVIHADLLQGIEAALPEGVPVLVVPTPPEIVAAYQIDPAAAVVPAGRTDWETWLAGFARRTPEVTDPPGAMIYTSGTTGRPKGVRRAPPSPQQALASALTIGTVFGLDILNPGAQKVVSIIPGPMYHSAPNAYSGLAVRVGADVVLQPRFDPEDLLRLIDKHRVTHIQMVPTMFVRLLKLPEEVRRKYDISSLKFIVHAAAPCPPHVKRGMIEWFGPIINEYYGATETGAVVFCTSPDWLAHPGTVGKPLPDVKLRILDEAGNDVPQGTPGDIYVRLTTGLDFTYHGDDEKRRKAERDGLISAGDIGYQDTDGFIHLCDRRNNMVISGGVNIYPAEIEAELLKVPGVADGAVFGIPDEDFGEALCAVVQPYPDAAIDAAFVRTELGKHLARYKVPKTVTFHAELPREDSGKIFKRKLRDPYWEKAGRTI
ncbi:Long-chain-fatty-acid--CoA ligase [Alphaproteobacteria bacterium SO-S41]|nr:Long-chain-fatty-acid--CoA ligase [Alphaproteobacteria bacterium SO-S41]